MIHFDVELDGVLPMGLFVFGAIKTFGDGDKGAKCTSGCGHIVLQEWVRRKVREVRGLKVIQIGVGSSTSEEGSPK
jgi:hypothetical protein